LFCLESILDSEFPRSFNFGPIELSISVQSLVSKTEELYGNRLRVSFEKDSLTTHIESQALNLDSNLANEYLNWVPVWDQEIAIRKTLLWWKNLIEGKDDPKELCISDINEFFNNRIAL
jgi:nucleoside-diphosphate-sugar epimerase